MNVYDAVKQKRAVRKFKDQPLAEAEVERILNAGRLAQSSKNVQPWYFLAIQDRARLAGLSKLGDWAGHLAGAALGVAILTPDPDLRFSIMFDAGQAAAYMQLTALEMGIGSCLATIYQPEAARALLGFPETLHLRIAISFGYPSQTGPRPPRKSGRRGYQEVVHWEKWAADGPVHNPYQPDGK
jgi:nitroreductase